MARKSSAGKSAVKKATRPKVRKEAARKSTRQARDPSTRLRAGLQPVSVIKNDAKILKALYEIASASSAVKDLRSFYKRLHKIVGKLMYAKNFLIALNDPQSDLITWPYYVDTVDIEPPPPIKLSDHRGAPGWILHLGKTIADGTSLDQRLLREPRRIGMTN